MSKFEGFIDASSYSTSKASSTLPHIQPWKLYRCFLIYKLEGFIDTFSYLNSKVLSSSSQKKKKPSSLLLQESLKTLGFIDADAALPPLKMSMQKKKKTSFPICCCNDLTLYTKLRSLLKRNNNKRHFLEKRKNKFSLKIEYWNTI